MKQDLEKVVRQALYDAQCRGLDLVGQQRFAMKVVSSVRPDMSETEILERISAAYSAEGTAGDLTKGRSDL